MSLVVALSLLFATAAAQAGELTIYSTYQGTVYLRISGTGDFDVVAKTTPVTVTVSNNRLYDVRVIARLSWWRVARGEQPKVSADTVVTIPMAPELDMARIALVATLVAAVGGVACGYRLRTRAQVPRAALQSSPGVSDSLASTVVKSQMLPDGQRMGPYTVVSVIARGGMGTVYEVEDMYGDHFAMKVPLPGLLESQEDAARFRREVEIGKTLNHPNVVRIFDYNLGEAGPDPYIVLELVRGDSLRDLLRRDSPMDPYRAIRYMEDILTGLQHGHDNGVIHRDVKPGNVLIAPDGACKVTDYGIAKAVDVTRITATHQVIGTPLYMAPEQLRSSLADVRVDVYAAGVILFELCTRHLPFDGEDQYVVFAQKISDDPPDPRTYIPGLSPQLVRIIFQALARDPNERYQTAQAFLNDLMWFSNLPR
jgi:hypothetical protein